MHHRQTNVLMFTVALFVSSQVMVATLKSVNRLMDKYNVVYVHNQVLLTYKKNEILSFAGKLIEVEIILLSEISQTQEDKYYILSHEQDVTHVNTCMKVYDIVI